MTEIIENLSDYFMRYLLLFCFAEEMRGGETTLSHSKWKLDNMYLKDCIRDVLIKICATRYKDNGMTVLYTDDEPESADTETASVSNIFGHAIIYIPNIFLYHQ